MSECEGNHSWVSCHGTTYCRDCDVKPPAVGAREMRVQYSGKRLGKSMQNAMELAEKARQFTSVKIVVMPHEDYDAVVKESAHNYESAEKWKDVALEQQERADDAETDLAEANEDIHEIREAINARSENVCNDIRSLIEECDQLKSELAVMTERADKAEAKVGELREAWGPAELKHFSELIAERDRALEEVKSLKEDLSANRQCYYEVVAQRNDFARSHAYEKSEREKNYDEYDRAMKAIEYARNYANDRIRPHSERELFQTEIDRILKEGNNGTKKL